MMRDGRWDGGRGYIIIGFVSPKGGGRYLEIPGNFFAWRARKTMLAVVYVYTCCRGPRILRLFLLSENGLNEEKEV